MDLPQLISALSRPEAFPVAGDEVDVVQTHISVVFLTGDRAYKIKKPVELGFLDFRTLEQRRHFCEEEVRLNRRGAPDVYLGVRPIMVEDGLVRVAGSGEPIEYAVEMRRLPEDRTLASMLDRGDVADHLITRIARRVADFHAEAESGVHLAEHGGFETVAFNVRENFEQLQPYVGQSISRAVLDRLVDLSEQALAANRGLIEDRAARGLVHDTHGDLHLAHVYVLPGDENGQGEILLVDCIEFNERFRYADPVCDVAFLVMDLGFHGRTDLARVLASEYFAARGDDEGQALLPFYVAYRAVVRGKVESFALSSSEIPEEDRRRALARARPYMLLALGQLATPTEKPCLAVTTGLPGTGKSRLANALARSVGFVRVSTDLVRKQLAGVPEGEEAHTRLDDDYYSAEWSERTYEECIARAADLLSKAERVVIDGTFREQRWRTRLVELADAWAVPLTLFVCETEPEVVKERLATREADASDATWEVYRRLVGQWEPLQGPVADRATRVDTSGTPEATLDQALSRLVSEGLA